MGEITTVEGEFVVPSDGFKLYTKTWKPVDSPKAILIFMHGFSDHCNAYDPFFTSLASQKQIEVRSLDQRGWGRSVQTKAQRGLTGPTALVLSDMTAFIAAQLSSRGPPAGEEGVDLKTPCFLMGHSMGGCNVLSWLGNTNNAPDARAAKAQLRGFLAQAPFIRDAPPPAQDAAPAPPGTANGTASTALSTTATNTTTASTPSKTANANPARPTAKSLMKLTALRAAARVAPAHQITNTPNNAQLSRDPVECAYFTDDALCHDTGTLECLAGLAARADAIARGRLVLPWDAGEGGQTRLWMAHGTGDVFCDYRAIGELAERSVLVEDKTVKLYEGWYHQLHAEPSPDKETYLEDVSGWILARSGPLETTKP